MGRGTWTQGARLEAAAVRVERQLHRDGVVEARRFAVRTEARAIVTAVLAFGIGLVLGRLGFWGRAAPVWEGASVGAAGIVVAASDTLAAASVSYRLAVRDPRQAWLKGVAHSRRGLMTAGVGVSVVGRVGLEPTTPRTTI